MNLIYNSFQIEYKTPFGACKTNGSFTITVKAYDVDKVYFNLYVDYKRKDIEMEKISGDSYRITIFTDHIAKLLFYHFTIVNGTTKKIFGPAYKNNGQACEMDSEDKKYQITVYKDSLIPEWFTTGNMYQIYVERFFNGNKNGRINNKKKHALIHTSWDDKPIYIRDSENRIIHWDFFGGNLAGVREKLSYLSLVGITIIYLNPIFESSSNHKYDTGDYSKIDSMYGDEKIFKTLIDESKKLGITIILDGVFSHVGSDSIYFNREGNYQKIGAYQSEKSAYYEWFTFEKYPDLYDCWWDINSMPNVNELNEGFLDYLFNEKNGIVRKWMRFGIGGFRLDVADELPDAFLKILKKAVREENDEAILLGEVWEDASNKISYDVRRDYLLGESLDSVTNYPLRDQLIAYLTDAIDSKAFCLDLMCLYENYPEKVFYSLMNMTGTHDTMRLLNLFANCPHKDELTTLEQRDYQISEIEYVKAVNKVILYATVIYSMPGIPTIYYGDEVGVEGYEDPYNRATYPWGNENENLLIQFSKLANLRKNMNQFKKGTFTFLSSDTNTIIIKREYEKSVVMSFVNNDNRAVSLKNFIGDRQYNVLFAYQIEQKNDDILLPSLSSVIIELT